MKLNSQSKCNNKETAQQLGEMDYVDFQVRRIGDNLRKAGVSIPGNAPTPITANEPRQETEFTIAQGHKSTVFLPYWIRDHRNDPALTVCSSILAHISGTHTHLFFQGFVDLLHSHLRERLSPNADMEETVFIKDDTLYEHPLLTINYTAYDLRRDKDAIHLNFGNQAVLVYSPVSQGDEPWLYAHVVAIYHVFACTRTNPDPKRLELLWVRWMQRDATQLGGPNASQYTRISFIPYSGTPGEAFGFVDPSHVIRGCHLIPVFDLQRTRDRLGASMARDKEGDWRAFYANRFDPHTCIFHLF